jgi:hypothetical protein
MNSNDHTYVNATKINQILFEQELFINKCSSYIDTQKHYALAELILNTDHELKTPINRKSKRASTNTQHSQLDEIDHANQTVTKKNSTTKSNIKKFRQVISNKLKKLVALHNSPEELNFIGQPASVNTTVKKSAKRKSFTKPAQPIDTSIKLVNFNYQPNFVNLENSASRKYTPARSAKKVNTRRNSTGYLSSSSSVSSLDSNQFLYISENQPQQPSSCNNLFESQATNMCETKEFVETSTPIFNNRIRPIQLHYADRTSFLCANSLIGGYASQLGFQPKYQLEDEDEDEQVNMGVLMDQSTQAIVDSPVLVESTFNTSSLSNLSDDLIILQTASKPRFAQPLINSTRNSAIKKTPKSNKRKSINSRLVNDSLIKNNKIPTWANGYELNMALVNQLYFNPSGNGVFNATNVLSINNPSVFI